MKQLPKVDIAGLKPDANNAVRNVGALQDNARATKEQVMSVQANFAQQVEKAQAVMDEALDKSADKLGIDRGVAHASLKPQQQSSGASVAFDTAAGGLGVTIAQSVLDVRSDRIKLTPAQEAKLMDEMYSMLTPTRDERGNITAPAEIESDFDFEKIKPQDIKEIYKAPEQHREGQVIAKMLHDVEGAELHLEHVEELENNGVNTGDRLNVALEQGKFEKAVKIAGTNEQALEKVAEVVEQEAPARPKISAAEVLMAGVGETRAGKIKPETVPVELGNDVRAAAFAMSIGSEKIPVPSINREFKPQEFTFGAA
jgi:hypothetical protein